jgi:diguanylate cyclase (GGDEF)-like protein
MPPWDRQVTGCVPELLVDMSSADGLTGTMSRGAFVDRARNDVIRVQGYRAPLSCVIIDIDGLKSINDNCGSHAGDLALQHVAAVGRRILRSCDYMGRVGDDEFAIILPEMPLLHAAGVAERLRRRLAAEKFGCCGQDFRVSASIGVAERPKWSSLVENLLDAANCAMQDAKMDGRDRVACFFESDLRVSTLQVSALSECAAA